eukprot:gene19643-26329_t
MFFNIDSISRAKIPPQVDRVPMICTRNKEFLRDEELFAFLNSILDTGGIESYFDEPNGYTPAFGFIEPVDANNNMNASNSSFINFDGLLAEKDLPPTMIVNKSSRAGDNDSRLEQLKAQRAIDDGAYERNEHKVKAKALVKSRDDSFFLDSHFSDIDVSEHQEDIEFVKNDFLKRADLNNEQPIGLLFERDLCKASPQFAAILSKNYPTFDTSSDDHMTFFGGFAEQAIEMVTSEDDFSFSDIEQLTSTDAVKGLSLDKMYNVGDLQGDVDNYLLTLLAIWRSSSIDDALGIVLGKLKAIEEGTDADQVGDVFDDKLNNVLAAIERSKKANESDEADDLFEKLTSSKLGQLAQDISKSLPSLENIKDPKDLFSMSNIGNLGKMMGQVSEALNTRIKSGEINHQDIVAEAFDMMKMIDKTGSLFKNINKSAFEAKGKKAKTRQRLCQKLATRKN